MRTLEECLKIVLNGNDALLTPEENKLIKDENDRLAKMISTTDKLIAELKNQNKG